MKTLYKSFRDQDPLNLINLKVKEDKNYSLGKGVYFAYNEEFSRNFQLLKNNFSLIGKYKVEIPENTLIISGLPTASETSSNSERYNEVHKLYKENSILHHKKLYETYEEFCAIEQVGREVCLKTIEGYELLSFSVLFNDGYAAELYFFLKTGRLVDSNEIVDLDPSVLIKVKEFLINKELL